MLTIKPTEKKVLSFSELKRFAGATIADQIETVLPRRPRRQIADSAGNHWGGFGHGAPFRRLIVHRGGSLRNHRVAPSIYQDNATSAGNFPHLNWRNSGIQLARGAATAGITGGARRIRPDRRAQRHVTAEIISS